MPEVPCELAALSQGVAEQDELYTFCNAKRASKNKGEKKTKTGEKKTKNTLRTGSI